MNATSKRMEPRCSEVGRNDHTGLPVVCQLPEDHEGAHEAGNLARDHTRYLWGEWS